MSQNVVIHIWSLAGRQHYVLARESDWTRLTKDCVVIEGVVQDPRVDSALLQMMMYGQGFPVFDTVESPAPKPDYYVVQAREIVRTTRQRNAWVAQEVSDD